MPRAGRPRRAEKGALKRRSILDAALEEFAEKGFAAARMEDVARRAGVGKGTIYLYFEDKESLFEGLVHEFIVTPLSAFQELRPRPGESVGEAVRRVMPPAVIGVAQSRKADLLRLLIGEGVRFPRLADSYRRSVVEPMAARMRALLAQAAEQGELANDAVQKFPQLLIAPALMGVIWTGLFARALPLDLRAMLDVHLDLLFPRKKQRGSR